MANEVLNFKKGLRANLPSAKAAGTIYVTTDERAMYIDIDASTRIRLGDFVECASMDALQALGHYSTTALYCVKDNNEYKLLKYVDTVDGKHNFVHLNSTSNVANAVSELATRVGSNETAITALQAADTQLGGRIDAEAEARAAADSTLDGKITSEATAREAADTALDGKITGHETRIGSLETASATHATKAELKAEEEARIAADNGLDGKITAVANRATALENTVGNASKGLVKDVEDLKTATSSHDIAITNINTEITSAKTRLTEAEEGLEAVTGQAETNKTNISNLNNSHNELAGTVAGHGTKIAALESKDGEIEIAITNINTELAKKATKTALEELSTTVGNNKTAAENAIKAVDDKAVANAGDIADLQAADIAMDTRVGSIETAIASIPGTYATKNELAGEVETLNGKIDLKADKTALEALSTTVGNNKTAAEQAINAVDVKADSNATAIINLQTRAKNIEDDVSDFKATVASTYVTLSSYNSKMEAVDKKDNDQDAAISALQTASGNHETRIGSLETASATHATKSELNEVKEGLEADIASKFAAADAMKFMGETASLAALKQKAASECEAGHTYVLTEDDSAANATVGDLFICEEDGNNQKWVHVKSGYVADHEATMSVASNKISLKSYTGANLGEVTFAAKADSAVTVSTSGSTVTIGMEWGSF